MDEKTMQILVDRYITAYNSFDVDSMAALMHPDCIFEHVSGGSTHLATRGIQEFRQAARQAETLFRTRRQEVIRYKFEGTRAEIGIDFEGDLSCDIPGVAQAGEKLTLTGTSIFEFKDGLIYKLTDYS